MSRAVTSKLIVHLGIAVAALVFSGFISERINAERPSIDAGIADRDLDVRASYLKGFTFGADGLVADVYYMRALQYIGDKIIASGDAALDIGDLRSLKARLLYPLLDAATDVDPKFRAAYSYGAVVLPAINSDDAIKLLEKGIAADPSNWQLYQHLGYIHWRAKDYEKAAAIYSAGSAIPGSSAFMKMMAGLMNTEGGSRSTARAIFTEMIATTDDPSIRNSAERRLLELDTLDQIDLINRVLADDKTRRGACTANLRDIMPQLQKASTDASIDIMVDRRGQLADAAGTPFLFDREKCTVDIDTTLTTLPNGN